MKLIYLIGEPGVGKTTTMRELTSQLGPAVQVDKPLAHRIGAGWMELGKQRGLFSGTDALSMSVQPTAIVWLKRLAERNEVGTVLGEGDRLGTASFLDAVERFAEVRLVVLTAAPGVAEQRRDSRGQTFAFNPQWLKGRISKVERLKPRADRIIDTTGLTPAETAAMVREVMEQ